MSGERDMIKDALLATKKSSSLEIEGVSNEQLDVLTDPEFGDLRRLSLSFRPGTSTSALRNMEEVEELEVSGIEGTNDLRSIATMPKLRVLWLTSVANLLDLNQLKESNIESLLIRRCPGLHSLQGIDSIATLGDVAVEDCPDLKDVSAAARNCSLTHYSQRGCPGVEDLSPFENCASLQFVDLRGPKEMLRVPDAQIERLRTARPDCGIFTNDRLDDLYDQ